MDSDSTDKPENPGFQLLKFSRSHVPIQDEPTNTKPGINIKYPKDAGCFPIKPGDVIMTRIMFDFLVGTIYLLPGMKPEELKMTCHQLATDLNALVAP